MAVNSAALTIANYIAQIFNLGMYVLAARNLGPNRFGWIAGLIGIAIVIASFADFGINGLTTRALAQDPRGTEVFSRTLSAKLVIAATLGLLWLIGSFVFAPRSDTMVQAAGFIGAYLIGLIVQGTLSVPLRASQRMTEVGMATVIEKASALVAYLLLQHQLGNGPESLGVSMTLGAAVSVTWLGIVVPNRFLRLGPTGAHDLVALWRSSFSFGVVGAAAQIIRTDVAIVGAAAGTQAAGLYAAPARVVSFLAVLPSSFSVAAFPHLAAGQHRSSASRDAARVGIAVVAVMGAGLLILGAAAPYVVQVALGQAYASSVSVLRVYLVATFIASANQPLVVYLQAEGRERYAAWAIFASATLGLTAIAIGARIGGPAGAAFGAILMQALQFAVLVPRAVRQARTAIPRSLNVETFGPGG